MIATLLLALAPVIVTDAEGCRWIKPATPLAIVSTQPRPKAANKAASAPKAKAHHKGKKRVPKPPVEGDELIGCDEDGPVWTSDITSIEFWPEEVPPVIEKVPEPVPQPKPVDLEPVPPTTFIKGCGCDGPSFWFPIYEYHLPIYIGGGFIPQPTLPVPEPEVWLLMVAGLFIVWRKSRQR